jgi:hypothetical protein
LKFISVLAISVLFTPAAALAQSSTSVLFVGNSFTQGTGSPARFYRADSVTDLNNEGIGGVPALFKAFTAQVGLDYDVYVETQPGSGLDFHIENRLGLIGRRPWDKVVMHGQSTLDFERPGDPAKLIATSRQLSDAFQARNPAVQVYLMATWSRADQTYPPTGAWAGQAIETMALDVRAASDKAAANAPAIASVIPVGETWTRAMRTGVADPNPYDGIAFEKIDLWTHDHYHASVYGYYLEALTVFGSLTGLDPRSLGDHECAAFELGMSRQQIRALQQVAFDQLLAEQAVTPAPLLLPKPATQGRCVHGR